jgi:hypothetical protein
VKGAREITKPRNMQGSPLKKVSFAPASTAELMQLELTDAKHPHYLGPVSASPQVPCHPNAARVSQVQYSTRHSHHPA